MTVTLDDHKQANPDIADYVDFGLRNGIAATRMLELFRETGGGARTATFMAVWRERRAKFARAATA